MYSLEYIIQCEAIHFGLGFLVGSLAALSLWAWMPTISSDYPDRRMYMCSRWFSFFAVLTAGSFSHLVLDYGIEIA